MHGGNADPPPDPRIAAYEKGRGIRLISEPKGAEATVPSLGEVMPGLLSYGAGEHGERYLG